MSISVRACAAATVALLLATGAAAVASSKLTTIRNPQGGQIVYGVVDGARDVPSAMSQVLRSIHQSCGERPRVGKVFQVRGTTSQAVFFTDTNHPAHNLAVAGLLIATRERGGGVGAALVTDEASRFGRTVNPMLQTVAKVWHLGGGGGSHARTVVYSPPQLTRVTAADDSASVSLPAGWRLNSASHYGTIFANGPHGELAFLGVALGAFNANDPRAGRFEAFAQGPGRNTAYGRVLVYPYGADLATTFVAVFERTRTNGGYAPAAFSNVQSSPLPGSGAQRCAHVSGNVNLNDSQGARIFDAMFCSNPPGPMGQFSNLYSIVSIPPGYAGSERGDGDAVLGSYSENAAVVTAQANRLAAPAIAQIRAIGRRAAQQAASAHAAEDRQAAAYEAHSDAEDRQSQSFSNYLLDQTVISDNENNAHGTVWNSTADAMVASDPSRYSYVNKADFWKGHDY